MSDTSKRAGAPEIEITDEMLAAGVCAVASSPFLFSEQFEEKSVVENLVRAVFREMSLARRRDS